MKTILLFLLISFPLTLKGQNDSIIGLYTWSKSIEMKPLTADWQEDNSIPYKILSIPGQKFIVVGSQGENHSVVIIKILDYKKIDEKTDKKTDKNKTYKPLPKFFTYNFIGDASKYESISLDKQNSRNYEDRQRYFKINKSDLKYARKKIKIAASLSFGVINFPFKYRPQKDKGDFSGNFNLGAAVGCKFGYKNWRKTTYSLLIGYSIGSATLDSISVAKNANKLKTTNNFATISLSIGGLIEYNKVQVGIFLGLDRINRINQLEFDWIYQSKPWISIGLGYTIFSQEKPSKNDKDNETN